MDHDGTTTASDDSAEIASDVAELAGGQVNPSAVGRLARALNRSARSAGVAAVTSGRWLAGTVMDLAPRIPVRSHDVLVAQHGGLEGAALAGELIRSAGRASAAVGAASGALMGAEELAPPAWLALPIELVAETLLVAAIEMKLIAELHEVYRFPVAGTPGERGAAIVRAWAERRGVSAAKVAAGGGLSTVLGRGTRDELMRLLRRRLMRRMGKNLTSLAPFLAGAAAGAEVNRRATRSLGETVGRDLAARHQRGR